jgi:hypothetical protein
MISKQNKAAAFTMKSLVGLLVLQGAVFMIVLKWMADDYRVALKRIGVLSIAAPVIAMASFFLRSRRSRTPSRRG